MARVEVTFGRVVTVVSKVIVLDQESKITKFPPKQFGRITGVSVKKKSIPIWASEIFWVCKRAWVAIKQKNLHGRGDLLTESLTLSHTVKTQNLLQVVNKCEQCCTANREQCCAAPSEQCCSQGCSVMKTMLVTGHFSTIIQLVTTSLVNKVEQQ